MCNRMLEYNLFIRFFSSHADFQLTTLAATKSSLHRLTKLKVKVRVTLGLAVYRQSVRLGVKPLETHD
jgi:hypothetical protein